MTMPRRTSLAVALAAAAATTFSGCGTQTLVAGLLVGLPKITYQPPPPAPGVTLPPQNFGPYTLLTGAVFTIDTSDPTKIQDAKVTGVSGVNASVNYRSCETLTGAALADCQSGTGGLDRVFAVKDQGSGLYALNSSDLPKDGPQFNFESSVRYTMVLEVPQCPDGKATCAPADQTDVEAFGASFKPGPAAQFKFANGTKLIDGYAKGTPMTLTRSDAMVDGQFLPAFVIVAKVDPNDPGQTPTVTYTSLDYKDPKKLLLLALSDQPYRKASFDIPGNAFTNPGYFVVALLSVAEGKASANAFVGSTALAASGDAGLVVTQ